MTLPEQTDTRVEESLGELRRSLAGDVVGPADAAYDAARRCFNALADRRPAVIVRCLGPDDVAGQRPSELAEALFDARVRLLGERHRPPVGA